MRPFWRWLPAKWAHDLAPLGLSLYAGIFGSEEALSWRPFTWNGIHFPNRLGLAGGVDKNAENILEWQRLGAGFVEAGTVTLAPQSPNPGKIIDRNWSKSTLWNKMGFPSLGAQEVYYNLTHIQQECRIPVFINLGKNRSTANSEASDEYRDLALRLAPLASCLVVNVSSPNTTGLRDLQSESELAKIIEKVVLEAKGKPVLVKLSPDQSESQLQNSLDASLNAGAQGFILTNTTLSREGFSEFPQEGGLSGRAVAARSLQTLKQALQHLGPRRKDLLIVSAGGVLSLDDINERLAAGADLVQVYSALVFQGPRFFQRIFHEVSKKTFEKKTLGKTTVELMS
jgi:dihydroorotate dehydrogenase